MVLDALRTSLTSIDVESVKERIVNPMFIQRFPEANIIGRLSALALLPVIIPISLVIILALHTILGAVLLTVGPDIFMEFFVTFLTLTIYVTFTYFWFQWVRTGGLGLFAI